MLLPVKTSNDSKMYINVYHATNSRFNSNLGFSPSAWLAGQTKCCQMTKLIPLNLWIPLESHLDKIKVMTCKNFRGNFHYFTAKTISNILTILCMNY